MKFLNWFIAFCFLLQNINCKHMMQQPTSTAVFPVLPAKTLAGRKLTFPDATKGKKSFLVLAFEDKGAYENCQQQAELWATFWDKHMKEAGIDFYEIPMMSGKYKWVSFWVDSGMRAGIDKQKHDNVACFYGDKSQYINALNISDLSQAHVFLLNDAGEITARASGAPNETSMNVLLSHLP
jgi:hypothetical protein